MNANGIIHIARGTALLLLAAVTSGCVHDMYYVSAKERQYLASPTFQFEPEADPVKEAKNTAAPYTSSTRVMVERYKEPGVLGTLYIRNKKDPLSESTALTIRKQKRSYMAEIPLFSDVDIGKKKLSSHFSIGAHKDHKAMVGLVFRMKF